jgi:putative membrane protein
MGAETWSPYCGPAPSPGNLLTHWNFDIIVGMLAGIAMCFFLALRNRPGFCARRYIAAMAAGFIVFVSPLCALSAALFSARVIHHLLLVLVAAPLLAGSLPKTLPFAGGVLFWTALQALVLWFWHAPAAYGAALSDSAIYWVMQATLVGASVGFWTVIRRSTIPAAVSGLIVAMLPMGLLGAVLTLAPAPFYAPHFFTTESWGLSPLEDQQLGGLIMWAPAAGVYLAAALVVFSRTLRHGQRLS